MIGEPCLDCYRGLPCDQHTSNIYPYSLKEAAAILNTSPDNLRGAIARGSLKARKMGRDWFVTKAETERYRSENRRESR